MSDYRKLKVWEKAHALTLQTYAATKSFPREELYGLTSQLRRASVSIGSNIAEGTGRRSPREFAYFLRVAIGSAHEIQYQYLVARDLGWLSPAEHAALDRSAGEVRAMLDALHASITKDQR